MPSRARTRPPRTLQPRMLSARTAAAAVGAGGLLLSGCGSSVSPAAQTAAELHDRLPQAVKSAGKLRIGSNLNYAPVDFKDQNGAPAGLDPELAAAIGSYLGLRIEFVDMPFETLIPAVQSKKIDLAMSAVIDTKQRQQGLDDADRPTNPGVDFVDYFITGTSILVKNSNPLGINSLDDLCDHTVAMQRGTIQAEMATRQIAACTRISKPLKLHLLETDEQALAEVASGAAAADLNDYPIAEYNTQAAQGGKFQLVGGQLQSSPYALTLNKDDTALRDVLTKALNQLIRDGSYDKILTKWNVHSGAIQGAVVNGAAS